jgi:uncharacterized tellurite resistance protein B-like protein
MIERILEAVRRFGGSDNPPQENLIPIAAATLLMEVAWADHQITDDELIVIRRSLATLFDLDAQTIEEIIEESRTHQDESVGIFSFTRTITEAWDEPDRFKLVAAMWELALEDESLHRFEEHMIRKIAELLYVAHARFIEAKQLARSRQTEK